jgi:ubiquinone/menaquinone biosynthesis C-methylase UbiE
MRVLGRLFRLLLISWSAISIGFILGLRRWYQEREGRGGPMPVSQAGLLVTPLRLHFNPPRQTLEHIGIRPGQTVLELGPGPGFFTPEAARMAEPDGCIVCIDVQSGMLALLRDRLREHRISNAHPIAGDGTRLPLASGSADVAFLVSVFGEIPDRPAALAELRRVLRPGGRVSFLETLGDPDYVAVDTMKDLCRAFGFQLIEHQRGWYGYLMTFAAPAPDAGLV